MADLVVADEEPEVPSGLEWLSALEATEAEAEAQHDAKDANDAVIVD